MESCSPWTHTLHKSRTSTHRPTYGMVLWDERNLLLCFRPQIMDTYPHAHILSHNITQNQTHPPTHLIADSRVRARAAHAGSTPPAVVPTEHQVKRPRAHHAVRGNCVWHPELVVVHLGKAVKKGGGREICLFAAGSAASIVAPPLMPVGSTR